MSRAKIIGISGGSGSGKTTIVRKISEIVSDFVFLPQYDFVHHRRMAQPLRVEPKKLILFDGILIFCESSIRDLIDLKLYADLIIPEGGSNETAIQVLVSFIRGIVR